MSADTGEDVMTRADDRTDDDTGGEIDDDWVRAEWWRVQNPGISVARGLLWMLGLSTVFWVLVICVIMLLT